MTMKKNTIEFRGPPEDIPEATNLYNSLVRENSGSLCVVTKLSDEEIAKKMYTFTNVRFF